MAESIKRNLSWLTVGNAVSKPLWLIFIIFLCVRVLGDLGYGVLTATLFLAAIINVFADWGFTQYTIREVSRRPDQASTFLSNLLTLQIGLSVVSFGLTLLVGRFLGYEGAKMSALVFASLYTIFLSLTTHLRGFYRAIEIMKMEAASVILEKVLVVAVGTVLLFVTRSTTMVLGGMAGAMAVTFVGNLLWINHRIADYRPDRIDTTFTRKALAHAIPLGLAAQFVMIYLRTDGVMVDAMIGESAAGLYGLAFRIIEATYLIPGIVTSVLYPRLSTVFAAGDRARLIGLTKSGAGGLFASALVMSVIFAAGGRYIIEFLSGDPVFAGATGALQILAIGLPLMFVNYTVATTLSAADDQKRLAIIMGFAALFNVATNFVMIPRYSFYGAAWATVATELLLCVALLLRLRGVLGRMEQR